MSETLYLDTARLGLISPSAQRIQIQFARLASDPQGLLYFGEFLSSGLLGGSLSSWQAVDPHQHWNGVQGLQKSLRYLVNAPGEAEVLLASRSATVMHIAAQQLAKHCDRVLTADLLWPPYRRILVDAFRRTSKSIRICSLRHAVIQLEASRSILTATICQAFDKHQCDGLLLPLIDHHGVTLPIADVVSTLRVRGHSLRQVVIDASQSLGHIPVDIPSIGCDLLIGGTHKWLGGYQPLGIGISLGHTGLNYSHLASLDPLLRLTQEQIGGCRSRHGETSAVLPLLTAAGALADSPPDIIKRRLEIRRANRREFTKLLTQSAWRTVRVAQEDHGIVLSRPPRCLRSHDEQSLRNALAMRGIAATVYPNGLVRFSMPHPYFSEKDLAVLRTTLKGDSLYPCNHPSHTKGKPSCPTVEPTIVQSVAATKQTKGKSAITMPMASNAV